MVNETLHYRRPFGFYVCSLAFTLERMAYYSAKFLIYAFVAASIATGGLGMGSVEGGLVQANLVAFTYLAPTFGGILSDRYIGARYCIPIGLFLMAVGAYLGSNAQTVSMVYIMIALIAIGTGLFKGNCSAITGSLFQEKDQLDAAFSTQYSFVNIGASIGTLAVGVLITVTFATNGIQGFRPTMKLIALVYSIAALWFAFGTRYLGEAGKKPFKAGKFMVQEEKEVKPLTKSEKKKVGAIVLVSLFSVIFWSFWYLTYLAVYDYGGRFIDWNVKGFLVPLSWFDTTNAIFCIILGPVLGIAWLKLARRPQGDLSLFKKLAFGLLFLATAFFILVGAEISRGVGAPETVKASILWIVLFSAFQSLGEMFFSPLGNSFITKYAPAKMFSVLIGVWTFATFVAGKSYGYFYEIASKYPFMQSYLVIPLILIVTAIILFVIDKKLLKLLED